MIFGRPKDLVGLDIGDSSIKVVELKELGRGRGLGQGRHLRQSDPPTILAPIPSTAEPFLELRQSEVQRTVAVRGTRLGADDWPLAQQRELDSFRVVREARVSFVGELDVDAHRLRR